MYVDVDIRDLFVRRDLGPSDCTSGFQFYTCKNSGSDFTGCCAVEACTSGCPDDKNQEKQGGSSPGGDTDSTTTPKDTPTSSPNSSPATKTKAATTSETPTPTTSVVVVTKTASDGRIETTSVLTTVTPALSGQTGSPDSSSGGGGGSKLSKGAIAGIAVGAGLAVALVILLIFFLRRRKKKQRVTTYSSAPTFPSPTIPNIGISEVPVGGTSAMATKTVDTSSTPGTLSSDPFAPFGGKYDPRQTHNGPSRASYVSSLGDTNTAQGSPTTAVSRNTVSVDGSTHLTGALPAQLDGEQIRPQFEMDASESAVARHQGHVVEMDGMGRPMQTVMELDGTPRASPDPGQMARGGSPPRSPPPRALVPGVDPRSTLNPEGGGQRSYVTSWSSYETGPGPAR